jgi:hypothetical protein
MPSGWRSRLACDDAVLRQSLAIRRSPQEAEDHAFVDAVSQWNDPDWDEKYPV